ncbi:MAG: MFS transporter [Promethearchaeota archaeon]|nr:MAG: MFS transporter [Candidatus Lokiarchaeota archaeon]
MSDTEKLEFQQFDAKQKWSFGLGSFAQWFVNSAFNLWVFTFYFSAVGLNIDYIMLAFILWSAYNAINDPLIGFISDKTSTRHGRRKPFIMIATVPIIILEIIIWTPPTNSQLLGFIYLLIMLFCYDTFYTMIALPYDSLFPELYTSVKERSEVNTIKEILSVVGLIFAALVPGIFIGKVEEIDGYLINGIVTSVIIGISLLVSLKWGVIEREEFQLDHTHEFNFIESLKHTLSYKSFILYTIMFFLYEYILLLLGTIVPLFGEHVLNTSSAFETSIIMGIMYIVGAVSVVIWKKLDVAIGSRKGYAMSIVLYFVATLPMLIIDNYYISLIAAIGLGIGFGGMLYYIYLIIADIIDADELKTGVRREGSFFGITNFFMRLSMIASILTVGLVFRQVGWEEYNPIVNPVLGLRVLFVVFPGIALGITLICLYFYPYTKERVEEMKDKLDKLHKEKKAKVRSTLK